MLCNFGPNKGAATVIVEIKRIRKRIPGIGSGKLYELIKPFFFSHQLKIGRDKLHQLMKKEGLLVKRKHYKVVTTQSDHSYKKYPNRIKDFIPTGTEQLWVSDITYIQVGKGFVYLSLIMDAFSRKAECRPIGAGLCNQLWKPKAPWVL